MGQEDLRELITRPIDTDEIQREIDRLTEEHHEVERELEELDSLKGRLPSLGERRTQLQAEIEETHEELAAKEAKIEDRDTDVEKSREEKAELEERLEELRWMRSDLEDVRYDLKTERESLESVRVDKREAESELAELPEAPVYEIDERESELDQLRERKRRLESEVNEIQSIIGFNQEMLEDAATDILDALEASSEDVTDELLPDETVTSWTCESEVPEEQIETTVGRLQELSQSKLGEVNDIESRIDELNSEISDLCEQQQRREELGRGIKQAESRIERLGERREELHAKIEEMEAELEEMEDEAYVEVLDLHREANQLEYEVGRLESDLEDVGAEISEVESRLDEESELEARRQGIGEEIEELRTKIERIETQAVGESNDHMDSVLDILEYGNLERIWLEQIERDVREGWRKVTKRVFELHIVRETADGATYEDTIDHLSESEREVTGLVFALAGYFAHEVYESVLFILLDSLESIDADRIGRLVEYVEGYGEYLVVTLLHKDAAALPDAYGRGTENGSRCPRFRR